MYIRYNVLATLFLFRFHLGMSPSPILGFSNAKTAFISVVVSMYISVSAHLTLASSWFDFYKASPTVVKQVKFWNVALPFTAALNLSLLSIESGRRSFKKNCRLYHCHRHQIYKKISIFATSATGLIC